jgi:hypothetical protein
VSIRIPKNSSRKRLREVFVRFTKTSSAPEQATWAELGRALAEAAEVTSGVASVIGNLLAFGQALRAWSAIVGGKSRWPCRAPDSFVVRDLSCARSVGEPPSCVFKRVFERFFEGDVRLSGHS